MAKREHALTTTDPSDGPKPKRKSSKKNDSAALSNTTAAIQAAFDAANVKLPGLSDTPVRKSKPTIKIEQSDAADNAVQIQQIQQNEMVEGLKSGKKKVKDGSKTREKKSKSKATPGQVESTTAAVANAVGPVEDVKISSTRTDVKPLVVINMESSDEDDSSESEDESDEDSEDTDDDADEDEDEGDEEEDGKEDNSEEKKSTSIEKPSASRKMTATSTAVAAPSPKAMPPAPVASCSNDAMAIHSSRSKEAEHYLYALINLRLDSEVIRPSLREMVFKWLDCGFDVDAIRVACQQSEIAEQLTARGATSERLTEISWLLEAADLLEHFASWVRKRMPDAEMLRRVCGLLAPSDSLPDKLQAPLLGIDHAPRAPRPLHDRPDANSHHHRTSNVSGSYNTSNPTKTHDGRNDYPPRSFNPPNVSSSSASRTDVGRPPQYSGHGHFERLSPSHDTRRAPATRVPYVRPGDAHKVLFFIVGTPDTSLIDIDYDAYDFRSACENAFGPNNVISVSRWSENTWKVNFRTLRPDLLLTPISYHSITLYPDLAFRDSPIVFASDFSDVEISDPVLYECITAVFPGRPGTIYRFQQEDKRYVIVKFKPKHAPDLLRFYALMPFGSRAKFMPAFKAYHHQDRACPLCQSQHVKPQCPGSRRLVFGPVTTA